MGTALQAKAPKRPATIEGAWEAQASPWVSDPRSRYLGDRREQRFPASRFLAPGRTAGTSLAGSLSAALPSTTFGSCAGGSSSAARQMRYAIVDGMNVRDSRVYN